MKHMLILAAILLLAGAILQTVAPAQAQTGGSSPRYTVQAGTTAGGGYQVVGLSWHVNGTTAGGGYRLLDAAGDGPWGQCCCTFLPLTLRNYK